MDVHPPKNGINRYWSIPTWRISFWKGWWWLKTLMDLHWQIAEYVHESCRCWLWVWHHLNHPIYIHFKLQRQLVDFDVLPAGNKAHYWDTIAWPNMFHRSIWFSKSQVQNLPSLATETCRDSSETNLKRFMACGTQLCGICTHSWWVFSMSTTCLFTPMLFYFGVPFLYILVVDYHPGSNPIFNPPGSIAKAMTAPRGALSTMWSSGKMKFEGQDGQGSESGDLGTIFKGPQFW